MRASSWPCSARLVALGGDGRPRSVELLGAARAREGLQRVEPEAARVRIERPERGRTADVRDPLSRDQVPGGVRDRGVRNAEQGELRVFPQRDAALLEARGEGRTDAAASDDVDDLNIKLQFRSGYRARSSLRQVTLCHLVERRRSSAALTRGQSSSITAYHAESRRSPPRTSMCLRWMPSNSAGKRGERGPRTLVQRVGLELDAAAAERLERVPEQEVLRLDVRAGSPGGRMHPRVADLEPEMLRREAQVARRARRSSRCAGPRTARACPPRARRRRRPASARRPS